MGAPKIYLHVQRKLYYMEGQWIFQRKRDIHVPRAERWVTSGLNWVLFKHHFVTIKLHKIIYMSISANQWVHQKYKCMYKENYTTWRDNDFFKESKTCMYQGGERWVRRGPDWVLFKHYSLTINMHKIIYMSMSAYQWVHEKHTCMYK